MDRANLTVLSEALVTRVTFEGRRATGVEIHHGGKTKQIRAGVEVILSLGAINTPRVLMQSGVGDQTWRPTWSSASVLQRYCGKLTRLSTPTFLIRRNQSRSRAYQHR
jgi:choline dehydrogenase-like flavoprotein